LLGGGAYRVEGAARGEGDQGDVRDARQLLRPVAEGGGAVEADRAEIGQGADQAGEIIAYGIADGGVAAALAAGAGDDIPQADMRRQQGGQAGFEIKLKKIAADDAGHEAPELVLRMGIITLRGERAVSRQAAEDQQADPGRDDRGEGAFLRHGGVSLSAGGALV